MLKINSQLARKLIEEQFSGWSNLPIYPVREPGNDNSDQASMHVTMQATNQADEDITIVLEFCTIPRNRKEIQEFTNYSNRDYFRKKFKSLN
jgi:hypothetical protein